MSDARSGKEKGGGREIYPVLPLRDIVVFPYMIVPLFVGREKSINALEEVMRSDKQILLAAQKNPATTIRPSMPSIRWARWPRCCSS
jgi:ATP-dependent Lon protease